MFIRSPSGPAFAGRGLLKGGYSGAWARANGFGALIHQPRGAVNAYLAKSPDYVGVAGFRFGALLAVRRFVGESAALLLALVPPELPLPDVDVPAVLGVGLGENVAAVVPAHEVEIGDVRGVGGGLEAA